MTQVVHFLESCPVRTGVGDKFGGYDETTCLVCKSEAILLPKGPDPFRFTFSSLSTAAWASRRPVTSTRCAPVHSIA